MLDFKMSACSGKEAFDTFDMANKVARRKRGVKVKPYKCQYCHHWHIGGGIKRKNEPR